MTRYESHPPSLRTVYFPTAPVLDKEKEIKAYLDGELLPEVRMKYEIAEEMGLLDRVLSDGWKSLSAKETGRIGGLMTKRKKEKLKK